VGHGYGPDSPELLDMARAPIAASPRSCASSTRASGPDATRWRSRPITAWRRSPPSAHRYEAAAFDSVGSLRDASERRWIDRVVGGPGARGVARAISNGDITFNADTLAALH